MKTGETLRKIKQQQLDWASNTISIAESSSWETHATERESNLFIKLSPQTISEYEAGAGKELDKNMWVLWSSSALLVNVFEYWRQAKRISDIAVACGAPIGMTTMSYERRYKIGRHGIAHLDIEFTDRRDKRFAIEAKFTEPYRSEFNLDKYLAEERYWQGLPNCKKLAEEIIQNERQKLGYNYLDATQLVKHILGLSYPPNNPKSFTLLYLWYDFNSREARELQGEIERFTNSINGEIDFRNMTYQELFGNIKDLTDVDSKYLEYLGKRYFNTD